MKYKIDTNAVTGGVDDYRFSDAGVSDLLEQETEVLITVVKTYEENEKTRAGGAFFKYINNTIYDLDKYGILKKC